MKNPKPLDRAADRSVDLPADADTLDSRIADAIEELEDIWESHKDEPYFEDRLHEIADSAVPVYTADLMEIASSNFDLILTKPELGPAYDGEPTPLNIIAANVYEAIYNAIAKRYNELKDNDANEGI